MHVEPVEGDAPGANGYRIMTREGASSRQQRAESYLAKQVIFSGGVMGTVDLLLKLKEDPKGLPLLSDRLGDQVRTNSESLIAVISRDQKQDLSEGIAISSIIHTDEHSHIEPCRYGAGSGFFRLFMAPHVAGDSLPSRLLHLVGVLAKHPLKVLRAAAVSDPVSYTHLTLPTSDLV